MKEMIDLIIPNQELVKSKPFFKTKNRLFVKNTDQMTLIEKLNTPYLSNKQIKMDILIQILSDNFINIRVENYKEVFSFEEILKNRNNSGKSEFNVREDFVADLVKFETSHLKRNSHWGTFSK